MSLLSAQKATVGTPNAVFREMQEDFLLVNALIGGTKAMRKAGEVFLPQEPKESKEAYKNRLDRSVLFNAYADTIGKLVSKPFSKILTLRDNVPDEIVPFGENIDKTGRNITSFAGDVFEAGLNHGLTHILIDFPKSDGGKTLEDQRAQDLRPYWIHIQAPDLIAWHSEMIDGVEVLTQIRVRENVVVQDGDWGEKLVQRVRVIYRDRFELYEMKKKDKWELVESGDMSLGFIPLVTFYTNRTGFMTARPPLIDLAYLNLQHWQSSSDQEHILHFIRFPLLHAAGFENDDDQIEIGPNRMIKSTDPASKLTYVEHSGAAVEAGRNSIADIEDRMSVMGMQLLIKRPGNQTATTSAIESAEAIAPLQSMVRDLENTLAMALNFTAQWLGINDGDGGNIDINQDFGMSLRDAKDVESLLKSRLAGEISRRTFLIELKRRALLVDDLDIDEEMERIEEEAGVIGGDFGDEE